MQDKMVVEDAPAAPEEAQWAEAVAAAVPDVYPSSVSLAGDAVLFMAGRGAGKFLGVVSEAGAAAFEGAAVPLEIGGRRWVLQRCPLSHANAAALRAALPWTAPAALGLRRSAGLGDRLGLATPGHLRSVCKHPFAPILAQQSIREMTRTERTPDEVMDAASWGVLQAGWRSGFGADADHLKTFEDIERCAEAGFTFFTIDPSAYVDNDADADAPAALEAKLEALPWDDLETTPEAMKAAYVGPSFPVGDFEVTFTPEALARAAVKYAAAVAHTARMHRHLLAIKKAEPFDLEMSVDETETPTSVQEHYFVAAELRRLGVPCVSLAPRFAGRMEKGVDFIGDADAFERDLQRHVAIARALGPYKLSLHSGSDKFSIYGLFARHAPDLFHLKTAGTSYLEALRAVSEIAPGLYREVLAFAHERYETDKATYHVSADPAKAAHPDATADADLPATLDQFDTRQLLHVTFGSALTARTADGGYRFRDRLLAALQADEEAHYRALERHFDRHLAPFDGLA